AARGIHVDDVAAVIHFDPPEDPKDYVHRSGRTARAGAAGVVVCLVIPEKASAVRGLQRSLDLPTGLLDADPTSLGEPAVRPARRDPPPVGAAGGPPGPTRAPVQPASPLRGPRCVVRPGRERRRDTGPLLPTAPRAQRGAPPQRSGRSGRA